MTRNVNDIIKSLPPSRRKIEKRAGKLIAEKMTLQESTLDPSSSREPPGHSPKK